MPLHFTLQLETPCPDLPARSTLRGWVARALQDTPHAMVTLRIVGRREAQRINRAFRHKDYAPNVLTFDYSPAPRLSTDIVLCWPVIAQEARRQDKSLRAHLAHMVIHGVLHARGFDHLKPTQAQRMEAMEIALLAALRITNPYE